MTIYLRDKNTDADAVNVAYPVDLQITGYSFVAGSNLMTPEEIGSTTPHEVDFITIKNPVYVLTGVLSTIEGEPDAASEITLEMLRHFERRGKVFSIRDSEKIIRNNFNPNYNAQSSIFGDPTFAGTTPYLDTYPNEVNVRLKGDKFSVAQRKKNGTWGLPIAYSITVEVTNEIPV